jgi:hypothetical protein
LHRRGAIDGRSHQARRWRDLYLGFLGELGRPPTETEAQQLRMCASLAVQSEILQVEMANGVAVNIHDLRSLSAELRRQLISLGLRAAPHAEGLESLST